MSSVHAHASFDSPAVPASGLDDRHLAWAVLLAHLVLWTLVPWLVSRNLPLDVVEALAWGREWQWGYYKHPPLSGWVAELARFGPTNLSLFALSQLMVTLGLLATGATEYAPGVAVTCRTRRASSDP